MATLVEDCRHKSEEKKQYMLLGEPTLEAIGEGRVRCVETGHEMPRDQAPGYATSKKCLEALFDRALAQRRPPLNFFTQSPNARNMVLCKLTGVVVKKDEDCIWKHVMGKKFQKKLEEEEAKKLMPATLTSDQGLESASISESEQKPDDDRSYEDEEKNVQKSKAKKNPSKKGNSNTETAASCIDGSINQDEEPDFWVPPLGDRWDFDCGGDRWTASDDQVTSLKIEERNRGWQVQCVNKDIDEDVEVGKEGDSEDEFGSDSGSDIIRMKRLSLSIRSSKSASLKKKRRIRQ